MSEVRLEAASVGRMHSARAAGIVMDLTHDAVTPALSLPETLGPIFEQDLMLKIMKLPNGLPEIVANILGTNGYVIGSAMLLFSRTAILGLWFFAASSALCAGACALYGKKYSHAHKHGEAFSMYMQACGTMLFALGATIDALELKFDPTLVTLSYFAGSFQILNGCGLALVLCNKWTGIVAPLWPNNLRNAIPIGFLNTLGALLFTVGSNFGFYDHLWLPGILLYLIGSIMYSIAAWGDTVIWIMQRGNLYQKASSSYMDATSLIKYQ